MTELHPNLNRQKQYLEQLHCYFGMCFAEQKATMQKATDRLSGIREKNPAQRLQKPWEQRWRCWQQESQTGRHQRQELLQEKLEEAREEAA